MRRCLGPGTLTASSAMACNTYMRTRLLFSLELMVPEASTTELGRQRGGGAAAEHWATAEAPCMHVHITCFST